MKIKSRFFGLLTVVLAFLLACTMVSCGKSSNGMYIDVPDEAVKCELGTYTIEIPNVRDAEGFVISDRTVTIKSVAYDDGTSLSVSSSNTITVTEPAIVKVTFQASGVSDAIMTLDFADRTAPVITLAESFPAMYFSGNAYTVPHYTANETLKNTSFKVDWYASTSAEPVSVSLSGYAFRVENSSGFYRVTIHVEDNSGNSTDYTYDIPVGGVSEDVYEEGTVVYFENEFGLEQATDRFNNLGIEFVAVADLPEGMVDEGHAIAGATKVWRDAGNPTGTATGEADIVLSMPYITNLSEYDTIYMDVYNPSSELLKLQIAWGGSVVLKPNAWTRAAWDIEILQMTNNAGGTRSNITGLVFCLATSETDSAGLTQDGGETLYFANLKAVKNGATEYRIPETDVKADKIFYTDTPAGTDNFFLRDGNWNNYSVEYVEFGGDLPQDTEGPSESKGMTKVTFTGISGSAGHLDTISSYLTNHSEYAYMAWRVYNPNDFAVELSYHTGGNDGNTSAPASTIPAKSFGTFYISFDYLDSYAYNRLVTRSANDIWLYVNGAGGTSIDGASMYFGACYGIRYTDLEFKIELSDREMDRNQVFDGGTYAPVVGESAAAAWTHGDELTSIYYKLSSAILNEALRVSVSDGKFTVDTLGECKYDLTYTAYMYTVTGGKIGEEVDLSSVLKNITASITITVTQSADKGTIEGEFVFSKRSGDGLKSITIPKSALEGEFFSLISADGEEIEATAETTGDNFVITLTETGLTALSSGESELQIIMLDSGINNYYKLNVTVWDMIISDADDMIAFGTALDAATSEGAPLTGWYLLGNDIDMSANGYVFGDYNGDPNKREGSRFFAGMFDGQGYSITGLKLGNKGLFNWVTANGVIRNLAIIDAYAYGYSATGTAVEQNVSHGSNILAEGFYGTLENVFVSGSIGTTHWSYSGLVWQMRAKAVEDCIFDIELRADATNDYDSALGAWIAESIAQLDNVVLIVSDANRACCLGGAVASAEVPEKVTVYSDTASCLAAIDMAGFDSSLWTKTEEGIFFGDTCVVFVMQTEDVVALNGSYELSKAVADNKLSVTLTDASSVQGTFVSLSNEKGMPIGCVYSGGTLTFTADVLTNLSDGENTLIIQTKDGGTYRRYSITVTVYSCIISDADELIAFGNAFTATGKGKAFSNWYKLDADIDMTSSDFLFGNYDTSNSNSASHVRFTGMFDGQGHSITGVKTGNGGLFGYVERAGVIKNVAIVNATGQGAYSSTIIGGGWFLGTLENVFVSGTIGNGTSGQDGIFAQNRALSIKNVVFDVDLTDLETRSLLGIWVSGEGADLLNAGVVENFFTITNATGDAAYTWAGSANNTVTLYADVATCLKTEDFSAFDSSIWELKADGVYFGGNKVIEIVTE